MLYLFLIQSSKRRGVPPLCFKEGRREKEEGDGGRGKRWKRGKGMEAMGGGVGRCERCEAQGGEGLLLAPPFSVPFDAVFVVQK